MTREEMITEIKDEFERRFPWHKYDVRDIKDLSNEELKGFYLETCQGEQR